jgi:hypothetical protein
MGFVAWMMHGKNAFPEQKFEKGGGRDIDVDRRADQPF